MELIFQLTPGFCSWQAKGSQLVERQGIFLAKEQEKGLRRLQTENSKNHADTRTRTDLTQTLAHDTHGTPASANAMNANDSIDIAASAATSAASAAAAGSSTFGMPVADETGDSMTINIVSAPSAALPRAFDPLTTEEITELREATARGLRGQNKGWYGYESI